jgi:hypothetical protein
MKFIFALLFVAGVAVAAGKVTGPEAEKLWKSLPGPVHGPFCTGLCQPGEVCDPPCYSSKNGQKAACTKTEFMKSHRIEYECEVIADDYDLED